jgi:thiosulfate/3-mercaptopyruvate sulfurtransferase
MTIADHHPEALVQTDWLEAHLRDPDLRIYECTTYLRYADPGAGVPYHPEAGRADYEAGHIPGAGFLDLPGELSRQDAPVHFMMPSPAEFAEVMGRHGLGDDARVVLYSRDRIMWATRVWWMLHALGFDRAAVLDGGFDKWRAEGRPVGSEPCAYPPAIFTPRPRPGLFVDKGAVLQAIDDPGACLINTLSEPDFLGQEPSRYGRPGRVPRSVNLPWPELTAGYKRADLAGRRHEARRGPGRRSGRAHRVLLRRRHLRDHGSVPAPPPRLRQSRAVRRLDGRVGARREPADRARLTSVVNSAARRRLLAQDLLDAGDRLVDRLLRADAFCGDAVDRLRPDPPAVDQAVAPVP